MPLPLRATRMNDSTKKLDESLCVNGLLLASPILKTFSLP